MNRALVFLIAMLAFMALTACQANSGQELSAGDAAPTFTLPSTEGHDVSLSDFLGTSNVLLYFNMAYG